MPSTCTQEHELGHLPYNYAHLHLKETVVFHRSTYFKTVNVSVPNSAPINDSDSDNCFDHNILFPCIAEFSYDFWRQRIQHVIIF